MNYLSATKRYYAEWLSVDPVLLDQCGKLFICSSERDVIQVGYSRPFDLYGYFSNQTIIIAYGQKLDQHISWIKEFIQNEDDLTEFKKLVKGKLGKPLQHAYKFYFNELPSNLDVSKARRLKTQDYPAFLNFFKTQYPDGEPEPWLVDYFNEMVAKGYAFGLFADNELVCASDAPDMPYMKEFVVELGINTLPDHRKKGYAKIVLGAIVKFLIDIQKVPIVSCASSNIASRKLIESVGFVKLADVVSLSL